MGRWPNRHDRMRNSIAAQRDKYRRALVEIREMMGLPDKATINDLKKAVRLMVERDKARSQENVDENAIPKD